MIRTRHLVYGSGNSTTAESGVVPARVARNQSAAPHDRDGEISNRQTQVSIFQSLDSLAVFGILFSELISYNAFRLNRVSSRA